MPVDHELEQRTECCATTPGFTGDIGAIEVTIIEIELKLIMSLTFLLRVFTEISKKQVPCQLESFKAQVNYCISHALACFF